MFEVSNAHIAAIISGVVTGLVCSTLYRNTPLLAVPVLAVAGIIYLVYGWAEPFILAGHVWLQGEGPATYIIIGSVLGFFALVFMSLMQKQRQFRGKIGNNRNYTPQHTHNCALNHVYTHVQPRLLLKGFGSLQDAADAFLEGRFIVNLNHTPPGAWMTESPSMALNYAKASNGAIIKFKVSPSLRLSDRGGGTWVAPIEEARFENGYYHFGEKLTPIEAYDTDGVEIFPEELAKYL